jgi:LuxR family transcriptional regulator, maltose regulon positive regulatory protein
MTLQRSTPAVLAAKLVPPSPRAHAVPRPDLIDRLEAAGPGRLRAVIAPTGWGKSELVAQWLTVHATPVAYVQLDVGDGDASRCWAHLLAAVEAAADVAIDDLLDALRSPGVALVREVVEPLLVRLVDHPVTVVLEDLHLVSGAEMEETLAVLADGRPPGVGFAFTTRAEPPLQLPRRRVRDEVVEIRLDDLRVDADAARAIVLDAAGLELDDRLVATLLDRTEGWAAGIYLAGLSLRAESDPVAAIERFAGDDRNLSEYLASEVLARLAPADREFLVGTAVLHELDGELCDAVIERSGSATQLADLARTNQFLIPLDQRAGRYRYHHLFREWLLLGLGHAGPGAVRGAHRRAARAHLARGDVQPAIEHALDGCDAELAYSLLIGHRLALLDSSQHATVSRWYRNLPPPPTADDAVETHLLRAWVGIIEGDLDTIDRRSARAAELLSGHEVTERVAARAGEPDLLRSYAALLRGQLDRCRAALDSATSVALPERAGPTVAWLDGVIRFWLGEPAQDALDYAYDVAVAAGVPYPTVLCQSYLALHASAHHDLAAAERWTDAAFATTDEHRVSTTYLAGPHAARAQVRQAQGELDGAVTDAEIAIELAERRNDTPLASLARLVLAAVHHTRGGRETARELLDVVARDLEPLGPPGVLGERLATARRQLRLGRAPAWPRVLDQPIEQLTDRELALLRLLPGDLTQRELGDALHMSFNTVKTYNRQIYRKLGVSSRDEAIAAARVAGLL